MSAVADTKAKEAFDEYVKKQRALNIAAMDVADARLKYIHYALQAGWSWNRIGGPIHRRFWERNRQRVDRILHGKPG